MPAAAYLSIHYLSISWLPIYPLVTAIPECVAVYCWSILQSYGGRWALSLSLSDRHATHAIKLTSVDPHRLKPLSPPVYISWMRKYDDCVFINTEGSDSLLKDKFHFVVYILDPFSRNIALDNFIIWILFLFVLNKLFFLWHFSFWIYFQYHKHFYVYFLNWSLVV